MKYFVIKGIITFLFSKIKNILIILIGLISEFFFNRNFFYNNIHMFKN